jgi:hypothetical protein
LKDELAGRKTSWWDGKTKTKGYVWTEETAREVKDGTGGTGFSDTKASEEAEKQPSKGKQGENKPSPNDDPSQKLVPPVQPVPT